MACRSQVHLERTIGNLVNPAVLRADLSGDPTFSQFLVRIKQLVIAVFSHQDYPFSTLVERLTSNARRDLSRSPFFSVFFSLNQKFMKSSSSSFVDGESSGKMSLGSELYAVEPITFPQNVSPFDLTLVMTETDTNMSAALQYNTDLFDAGTIERMAGHLQNLLANVVHDSKSKISELSCLDEREFRKVIVDWNNTQFDVKGKSVVKIFEQQVLSTPDAIALSDGPFHLSYSELNSRANSLAHYMRDTKGIKCGKIVGICVRRGYKLVLAQLAVMKTGAAYLPIDPAYPSDRIEYMLSDTNASLILSETSVCPSLGHFSTTEILSIDEMWPTIRTCSTLNVKTVVSGTDVVYIVYTSGSTGKPKGVTIMHQPLVSMSQWHATEYKHSKETRSSQMIAPAFDPVALEIWPFLTIGASVHVMSDETRSVPTNLIRWICAVRITGALFATPVAETVIHERWPTNHCLQFLTAGGDKLHRGPRYPHTYRFDNHYGPSENTVITTFHRLETSYDQSGQSIPFVNAPPIGKPVFNSSCYVLDSKLNPVPIGVSGELYVGGDCLAKGYWNRSELTKERFVRSPFSADPFARIYKTGDLVRYWPDGNLV